MRTEATLEQWKVLYEAATRIKDLKPWETFWDLELIAVQDGAPEDTVFFSILGHNGDCYGISVYEGYSGLNDFMMVTMQEKMNLSLEYVMFRQRNLSCYWGNREELSDEQRRIIKELGYKYRGKNQWMYFMSFEPGYYPYNMDQDEVLRMTEHLTDLTLALQMYEKMETPVDFQNGNMFLLKFGKDRKSWSFKEEPLPFMGVQYGALEIADDELLSDLAGAPKNNIILEADISCLGNAVKDKNYDRPANPALCMIGEAATGMILGSDLQEPEDDPVAGLAGGIVRFVMAYGAPKEIRVSNVIVEAGLEQICRVCGIKLRRVKRLKGLEAFRKSMNGFL